MLTELQAYGDVADDALCVELLQPAVVAQVHLELALEELVVRLHRGNALLLHPHGIQSVFSVAQLDELADRVPKSTSLSQDLCR